MEFSIGSTRQPTFSPALPKALRPDAKQAIWPIYGAERRTDAVDRVAEFAEQFKSHPKAVAKSDAKHHRGPRCALY